MSAGADRLAGLSREERAALFERLQAMKQRPKAEAPPALRAADAAPLSFAQLRLWFLAQLAPANPAYNVPAAVRLRGRLDVPALSASLSEIVRRHEALRTRFEIRGTDPVQRVVPAARTPLPVIDLAALPQASREPEERRLAWEEAHAPFDLGSGSLLRARLLRAGEGDHVLLITLHHIASDAWSVGVAVGELGALYPAFSARRPSPLPPLPLQYAGYALRQRERLAGDRLERELAHWRSRLAGALPIELPMDRPRPAVPALVGGSAAAVLPEEVVAGLRRLAAAEKSTLFMALLSAFAALLARLAGTDDVAVGTTVTGRNELDLTALVGFFINTLVLRVGLAGDPDGREIVRRGRRTVLEAFSHQELPFEKLVDELGLPRDPYRSPLLSVVFQLHDPPRGRFELPGLALEPVELAPETAKFDLVVSALEVGGALRMDWRYDRELFEPATIDRFAARFGRLLAGIVADPATRLWELPLLDAAERRQLLDEWNPRRQEHAVELLHRRFEAQADRAPDAVAVSCEGERWTYRELDQRANGLARHLIASGVVPGDLVGVSLDRGLPLLAAILGILKAGAGYVPLDPAYPEERRAFVLADSDVRLVVDEDTPVDPSADRPGLGLDPAFPAYVIYTSGSTGRPKGVVVTHANVSRLLAATESWFGFGPSDVWTLFHSPAFDFSVWEIWGPLLYGGRLVVVPYWQTRSPESFYRLLAEERVTVLNQTPSAFRQLLWAEEAAPKDLALRTVVFGGEALEPASLAPWLARHGDERPLLVNMYGITETTVHVTWRPIRTEDLGRGSVLGVPIPDLTVHVLDRNLSLQPVGVAGEICVGGAGLALGYLGRPELTAERFVPDPYGDRGARLYRSGDLAKRLPDGDLEYLGRIDHQVKIRGFRIELGEIEAALLRHPAVREAVVLARQDGPSHEPRLVAYVVCEGEPTVEELRAFLATTLPDHMLPGAFVALERLPLTENGKIDRRALPAPEQMATQRKELVPPTTPQEILVAGLFREVLGIPEDRPLSVHDDFFALGGSSISGAILINRLQARLGGIVQVVVIFDHPTIAALAAYVGKEHGETAVEERPATVADLAEMRRLVSASRLSEAEGEEEKNPPAVFVLAPPRSGTTLLRVMLGAHPRLFAPPELELLSFPTMASRSAAFSGRDAFWLEGVVRAVMEAKGVNAEEAERLVAAREGATTRAFYRELAGWLDGRTLVDKTPSYALDLDTLRRAERWFSGARYIHLLRHPQATNRSFVEAKLDQLFFRKDHPFGRRQLAELVWTLSHENILAFLEEVPAERALAVRFEDLVEEPERELRRICAFLGLAWEPAMAEPYRPGTAKMVDGPHAVSRMLGDVKLLSHGRVDPAVAGAWRRPEAPEAPPLGEPARAMAARLGYGDDAGPAPLSFAQERLWFLDQLTPGTGTYNIPSPLGLRGPVAAPVLAAALGELVRRHETLRTRFAAPDGVPVQIVDPPWPVPLPCVDLSALPEGLRRELAGRLTGEETARPFDLERGPLLRALLLRLAPDEHGLVLTVHHIVSDGWSVRILLGELTEHYRALSAGAEGRPTPLPALPLQYREYARWQRQRLTETEVQRQIAYWRERLAGAPPALDLPLDRPRPAVQTYHGQSVQALLEPALVDALRRLGLAERASLFMTLVGLWTLLLSRLAGQDDVLVGTPVAGRMRTEAESLIGCFLNTLVLRTGLSGGLSVRGLLRRVRETAVGAFAHQEIPFERLLEEIQPERDLSRTPLFQVFFNLANFPEVGGTLPGGVTVEPLLGVEAESKFDVTVYATESPLGVYLNLVYNADLFDAGRMEELLRQYRGLLVQAVDRPEAPLAALSLRTAEAAALLPDPTAPLPAQWVGAVHELLREEARARPDKVAVRDAAGDWTYRALDEASDGVAAYLLASGVGKEDCVAVWAHRNAALPLALFGVLKAGAAFTILDPAYPAARLAEMVGLARPRGFIALEGAPEVPAEVAAALEDVACRLTLPTGLAILPPGRVQVEVGPDDLALVAFTSGSTGVPKGILGRHGPLSHFLPWMAERFGLSERDRHTMLSGLSHDPLQRDVFTSLCLGATLAVPAPEDLASPGRVASWMAQEGITFANLTPAMAQLATEAPGGGEDLATVPSLRWLMLIGDVLTRRDVERLRRLAPQAAVVNLYGATETQRALSYHVVGDGGGGTPIVPLGVGMEGCQLLVLAPSGRPAGIGEVGEIAIRSPHLARGYLDDEAATRERFVANPATGDPADRVYRTGDLGRYLPDGQVSFAGRLDGQVKLRGFRIELGEIEAVLGGLPGVREAVTVVREEGERSLAAYVVLAPGVEIDALRRALRRKLPAYMVPSAFVVLERLPLLPNGKVDRRALPAPQVEARVHRPPATDTERTLAGLWEGLLPGRQVGRDDDFFALGGHSLLATRLLARVRDAFGVELPVAAVFAEPQLAGLAAAIDRAKSAASAPALPKLQPRRRSGLAAKVAGLSDAEVAEELRQRRGEEQPDA